MVMVPSLEKEKALWETGKLRVAGVDEAGRGPLAGPVVAAACLIPANCEMIEGVRDSKLLSPEQRTSLLPLILRQALAIGVGAASVPEIERVNIYHASHLAMRRALGRIKDYDHALIDGPALAGLSPQAHTAIVDGDSLCYAIACASIVAKVTRDQLMKRLGRHYPLYGWDHNVGYTTSEHLSAMSAFGLTPFHRRGYAPVKALLPPDPAKQSNN